MAVLDPIKPTILSARIIPNVHPDVAAKLELRADQRSLALVTCDLDDSLYVSLDEGATRAEIEIGYAGSLDAGSAHASGPLSGEIIGIMVAPGPAEARVGLDPARTHRRGPARGRSARHGGDRVAGRGRRDGRDAARSGHLLHDGPPARTPEAAVARGHLDAPGHRGVGARQRATPCREAGAELVPRQRADLRQSQRGTRRCCRRHRQRQGVRHLQQLRYRADGHDGSAYLRRAAHRPPGSRLSCSDPKGRNRSGSWAGPRSASTSSHGCRHWLRRGCWWLTSRVSVRPTC